MILLYPDPFLKKIVPQSTFVSCKNILKMFEVMNEHNAIGLAANQIGLSDRVIVVKPYWVFINPVIIKSKGIVKVVEGCLSLPGDFEVTRAREIEMECQTSKFNNCRYKFSGILAWVIQHEVDHLNGILINDKT